MQSDLALSGTGTGSVVSDVPGVDCPGVCSNQWMQFNCKCWFVSELLGLLLLARRWRLVAAARAAPADAASSAPPGPHNPHATPTLIRLRLWEAQGGVACGGLGLC